MNIILFYIVIVNKLHIVSLASIRLHPHWMAQLDVSNPSRYGSSETSHSNTVKRPKPTCGPVLFPEYSCESLTTASDTVPEETTTWKPQEGLFAHSKSGKLVKTLFEAEITTWKPKKILLTQPTVGKYLASLFDTVLNKGEDTAYDAPLPSLSEPQNIKHVTQSQHLHKSFVHGTGLPAEAIIFGHEDVSHDATIEVAATSSNPAGGLSEDAVTHNVTARISPKGRARKEATTRTTLQGVGSQSLVANSHIAKDVNFRSIIFGDMSQDEDTESKMSTDVPQSTIFLTTTDAITQDVMQQDIMLQDILSQDEVAERVSSGSVMPESTFRSNTAETMRMSDEVQAEVTKNMPFRPQSMTIQSTTEGISQDVMLRDVMLLGAMFEDDAADAMSSRAVMSRGVKFRSEASELSRDIISQDRIEERISSQAKLGVMFHSTTSRMSDDMSKEEAFQNMPSRDEKPQSVTFRSIFQGISQEVMLQDVLSQESMKRMKSQSIMLRSRTPDILRDARYKDQKSKRIPSRGAMLRGAMFRATTLGKSDKIKSRTITTTSLPSRSNKRHNVTFRSMVVTSSPPVIKSKSNTDVMTQGNTFFSKAKRTRGDLTVGVTTTTETTQDDKPGSTSSSRTIPRISRDSIYQTRTTETMPSRSAMPRNIFMYTSTKVFRNSMSSKYMNAKSMALQDPNTHKPMFHLRAAGVSQLSRSQGSKNIRTQTMMPSNFRFRSNTEGISQEVLAQDNVVTNKASAREMMTHVVTFRSKTPHRVPARSKKIQRATYSSTTQYVTSPSNTPQDIVYCVN